MYDPCTLLVFGELQAAVLLLLLIIFSSSKKPAWSPSPTRSSRMRTWAQKKLSLAPFRTFDKIFLAFIAIFRRIPLLGFARRRFVSYLLPCLAYVSLSVYHTYLWSARAPRVKCHFDLNGKHDVRHVGANITNEGAIGYGWKYHSSHSTPGVNVPGRSSAAVICPYSESLWYLFLFFLVVFLLG